MDRPFAYQDKLELRIAAGIDVMRRALDRQAPSLVLATAREAARAALLALGEATANRALPRFGKHELALLREMATASAQRFADRPAERQALMRATLALLERLFPGPAATQDRWGHAWPGAGNGDPAAPEPAQPARRGGTSWA